LFDLPAVWEISDWISPLFYHRAALCKSGQEKHFEDEWKIATADLIIAAARAFRAVKSFTFFELYSFRRGKFS